MTSDVVCGMSISAETAAFRLNYRGQVYHFCSLLCKQMFEREPEKYAAPASEPPTRPAPPA